MILRHVLFLNSVKEFIICEQKRSDLWFPQCHVVPLFVPGPSLDGAFAFGNNTFETCISFSSKILSGLSHFDHIRSKKIPIFFSRRNFLQRNPSGRPSLKLLDLLLHLHHLHLLLMELLPFNRNTEKTIT